MGLMSRIGQAASTVSNALFQRSSTNPNTDSTTSYLDMVYDREYRKIRRYKDYKEMMEDPQVKVGIAILQEFLLSKELHITPGGEDPLDAEASAFIENELKQEMGTPLRQVRKNLYTALPYRFSANEAVFRLREDGRIGIRGIYSIHRKTLDHMDAFQFNDQGELIGLKQQGVNNNDTISIDKILLYSFDMEFDDPRGQSILDGCYKNFYMKNKNLKGLGIFLEKLGAPFLVTKVANVKYKDDAMKNMEEVAEGRTNMTIGKEDDVEIKESSHDGAAYLKSIQYHDNMIFRRLFIGTLIMGQSGDTSGSYAQSQTQADVMRMILDGVHEEIAAAIQKTTDQLSTWNFRGAKNPKIFFDKFEDKDIIALIKALQPLVADMTIKPDEGDEWFMDVVAMAVKKYTGIEIENEAAPESLPLEDNPIEGVIESEDDLKGTLENIVPAPIGE